MAVIKKVESTNKTSEQFLNLALVDNNGTFLGYVNIPKRMFKDESDLTNINKHISETGVQLEHKQESAPLF